MSINEYLSNLNLDQLLYARDRADRLIKEKREEEKMLVWRVENSYSCRGNFAESDYLAAVELLCREAKKAHEKGFQHPEDGRFELYYMRVPASEYQDYVTAAQESGDAD